jgi:predicted CXXCH cytochrome family protein
LALVVAAGAPLWSKSGYRPGAGLTGSPHDFSQRSLPTCGVCHTPHHALKTVTAAPLWNHKMTERTYKVYQSATLDAQVGQPSEVSRLCLSCHDGSIAIDSFGERNGSQFLAVSDGAIAGDIEELSNDHPISFVYDSALASRDGELHDPSGRPRTTELLVEGKVECTSCHDVHNTKAKDLKLLRVNNNGSALCLTCHDK